MIQVDQYSKALHSHPWMRRDEDKLHKYQSLCAAKRYGPGNSKKK